MRQNGRFKTEASDLRNARSGYRLAYEKIRFLEATPN
jgi:hypothetical protein